MKKALFVMMTFLIMSSTSNAGNLPPYITGKMMKVCAPSVKKVCRATKSTPFAKIKACVEARFTQLSQPCQTAIMDMLPAIRMYEERMAAKKKSI